MHIETTKEILVKTLLLLALALISVNSFAAQLVGEFPKVQFGSVFVSVEEVCVDGPMIKTVYAVPVCEQWGRGEASTCENEVMKHLSTPINYMKDIPRGEGSFESVPMTIPLEYKIPYGYWIESGIHAVLYRDFKIPSCN
jgi:hypothetical protein